MELKKLNAEQARTVAALAHVKFSQEFHPVCEIFGIDESNPCEVVSRIERLYLDCCLAVCDKVYFYYRPEINSPMKREDYELDFFDRYHYEIAYRLGDMDSSKLVLMLANVAGVDSYDIVMNNYRAKIGYVQVFLKYMLGLIYREMKKILAEQSATAGNP